MYSHAPSDYQCPFCRIQAEIAADATNRDRVGWVFEQVSVFCIVPPHYWGVNKGNCLIIPKNHYENIFDLDEEIGRDLLRATKRLSYGLKRATECEGVSTRQHNEPAGNQDVWHYHLHVFPRFRKDGLYSAEKLLYKDDDRLQLTIRLREAVEEVSI